ncbi:MAG: CheC protein [Clostridia bacterium]|jgi:chemotaxis protein CheX|nr:CheC protein [Clostridia bacterium]
MKIEYINPFMQASQNVIQETTGLTPKLGKIYIKDTAYKGESVVVLIGLTGAILGNVIISFKKALACKIASIMMGGMSVVELDEISKSAIAELCNMILGNAASIFYKNSIAVDITPPTVLTGDNMQFSLSKSVVVCIPLEFDKENSIDIDITYKEN